MTCGVNYRKGLLDEVKSNNERCIFECSPLCLCSITCSNKLVQRGPSQDLYVKEVENKGWGLFTRKSVERGKFICEYAGEIIGREEAFRMFKVGKHRKYIFCLKEHCGGKVSETYIDATNFANVGRYANHSCSPNCSVIPVRTGFMTPRLAIFAQCNINKDEEITYAYGPSDSRVSSLPCFCGANACRGFLPSTELDR
ncbi:hypothetical protein AAG570_007775 [Ranatra chinensis]|uniref:Uncharacterized protein n=1 Tax=Ranatra chinensis TaxID=642074 RepID=A0ABD0XUI1_9HEMI